MIKSIYLGSGCFWCSEAVFSMMEGVVSTQPGYSGGTTPNPTYEMVCSGTTGHAEVTKVDFDPEVISLDELLDVFFHIHDPTSVNRQGEDVGEQYRSIIIYDDPRDLERINEAIVRAQKEHSRKIVTAVESLRAFYPAESYHKDYFKKNPNAGYCRAVIRPKVEKVKHSYSLLLAKH